MDEKLKKLLEFGGILATIASLAILFFHESYAIGSVVLIGLIIAIGVIVYLHRQPPYTRKKTDYYYTIEDDEGHKATVRKVSVINANKKWVQTLRDGGFTTAGKHEFKGSNLGELLPPINEGGTKTIYTHLKTPLPLGKDVIHEIHYISWDSFRTENENVSIIPHRPVECGIHVDFKCQRKPKRVRAYEIDNNSQINEIESFAITDNGSHIELKTKKTIVGHKYVLEWEW